MSAYGSCPTSRTCPPAHRATVATATGPTTAGSSGQPSPAYVQRLRPPTGSTAISREPAVTIATPDPLVRAAASVVTSTVRYQRRLPVAASSPTRSRQPDDFANSASTTPSLAVQPHSRALPRRYDQRSRPVAGSSPATRSGPAATAVGPSTGPLGGAPTLAAAVHSGRTVAGSGAGSGGSGLSVATRISVVAASLEPMTRYRHRRQPDERRHRHGGDHDPAAHPAMISGGAQPRRCRVTSGSLPPAAVGDRRGHRPERQERIRLANLAAKTRVPLPSPGWQT